MSLLYKEKSDATSATEQMALLSEIILDPSANAGWNFEVRGDGPTRGEGRGKEVL